MKKSKNELKTASIVRTTLIVIATVAVVAGLAVGAFFIFSNKEDPAEVKKAQQTADMETLGREFYTDLFYKQLAENRSQEELKAFLEKYKETGINTNLDNLSRTASDTNKKKAEKLLSEDNNCDKEKTRVYVYPKAPYGKDDYTVKVELACPAKPKPDDKKGEYPAIIDNKK